MLRVEGNYVRSKSVLPAIVFLKYARNQYACTYFINGLIALTGQKRNEQRGHRERSFKDENPDDATLWSKIKEIMIKRNICSYFICGHIWVRLFPADTECAHVQQEAYTWNSPDGTHSLTLMLIVIVPPGTKRKT